MIKKLFISLIWIFPIKAFSQGGYNNMTNHQEGNYAIEADGNIGKNNTGGSLKFGYYLKEYFSIRGGATYRKFQYKTYKENILEANIEAAYTILSPRYSDPFIHRFNVAGVGGFSYENVKVTSRAQLIDPYPKYIYFHLGGELEFTASDHIGIIAHGRQYYALNGSKEKLGNWRYDYGIGLRYYFWGR